MLSVDEAHLLERSLPAAIAQGGPDEVEVVVVDNACSDRTATLCEVHGARRIALRERRSYAAAINEGLSATDDPAVLLLNADCVLDTGFLAAAQPRLEQRGVGSVAPLVLRATGMEPADRMDIVDAAGMTIDRRRKNSLVGHGEPAGEHRRAREAFGGDGACVLYRRDALNAVAVGSEVLDEDMELWASDADLAWRVRDAGWRCLYEPAARAWHVRSYRPGNRALLSPEHRRLQFRNRLLMLAKNETARGFARDAPFILGYELLALGHALLRERTLLRGYVEAARLLPGARARRAARAAGGRGSRASAR
jgi:GT2 family glycosyltransferase